MSGQTPEQRFVYIVEGSTGSYDEADEWPVAAYMTEAAADEHVRLAATRARELTDAQPYYMYDRHRDGTNEWDPNRQSIGGAHYISYAVPLMRGDRARKPPRTF